MHPGAGRAGDRGGGLLPDVVLPTQHFVPSDRGASLRPEQRLALAVIQSGLAALRTNAGARSRSGRRRFAEAARWFAADDAAWPFSFVNACHMLGGDPRVLRVRLGSWLDHEPVACEVTRLKRCSVRRAREGKRRVVVGGSRPGRARRARA